ncbi:kinase-like domain-containing protein [Zopfochytrium polystomum]|nr:kinase-like domain-containing protein [Zopfochytrium polystomum]
MMGWIRGGRTEAAAQRKRAEYKTLRKLGEGTYGLVEEAIHYPTGEHCAIKQIKKKRGAHDDRARHIVHREMRILRDEAKDHPNVIKLKDFFETVNFYFMVFELATGGELFERISQRGRFTERNAAEIVFQILHGVSYLHSRGIAHRDLKPENILYRTPDERSDIVIADFGMSNMVVEGELLFTLCGSPAYAAPEVIARAGHGKAADIWSIGVIAYTILMGFGPWWYCQDEIEMLEAVKRGEWRFISPAVDSLSPEAQDFVRLLMNLYPERRPTGRQAMADLWIRRNSKSARRFAREAKEAFRGFRLPSIEIDSQGNARSLFAPSIPSLHRRKLSDSTDQETPALTNLPTFESPVPGSSFGDSTSPQHALAPLPGSVSPTGFRDIVSIEHRGDRGDDAHHHGGLFNKHHDDKEHHEKKHVPFHLSLRKHHEATSPEDSADGASGPDQHHDIRREPPHHHHHHDNHRHHGESAHHPHNQIFSNFMHRFHKGVQSPDSPFIDPKTQNFFDDILEIPALAGGLMETAEDSIAHRNAVHIRQKSFQPDIPISPSPTSEVAKLETSLTLTTEQHAGLPQVEKADGEVVIGPEDDPDLMDDEEIVFSDPAFPPVPISVLPNLVEAIWDVNPASRFTRERWRKAVRLAKRTLADAHPTREDSAHSDSTETNAAVSHHDHHPHVSFADVAVRVMTRSGDEGQPHTLESGKLASSDGTSSVVHSKASLVRAASLAALAAGNKRESAVVAVLAAPPEVMMEELSVVDLAELEGHETEEALDSDPESNPAAPS